MKTENHTVTIPIEDYNTLMSFDMQRDSFKTVIALLLESIFKTHGRNDAAIQPFKDILKSQGLKVKFGMLGDRLTIESITEIVN